MFQVLIHLPNYSVMAVMVFLWYGS